MPPLTLPPPSSKRQLYFDGSCLLKNILLGLSLLQKKTSKEIHLGNDLHQQTSCYFSSFFWGLIYVCVFPLESATYCSMPCGFWVFLICILGATEGRYSLQHPWWAWIITKSVNHWTSFTPVIKLSKDRGLCITQEDWSRTCNQTVLLTAHTKE